MFWNSFTYDVEIGKFPEPHSFGGSVDFRIRLDLLSETEWQWWETEEEALLLNSDSAVCGEVSVCVSQPQIQVFREYKFIFL